LGSGWVPAAHDPRRFNRVVPARRQSATANASPSSAGDGVGACPGKLHEHPRSLGAAEAGSGAAEGVSVTSEIPKRGNSNGNRTAPSVTRMTRSRTRTAGSMAFRSAASCASDGVAGLPCDTQTL
jgi:hypothetical protein